MSPVRVERAELDRQVAEIVAYKQNPEAHFVALVTQLARGVEDFRIALTDSYMMYFNFDSDIHHKLHGCFLETAGLDTNLQATIESGVIELPGSDRVLVRTVTHYENDPERVHTVLYHGEINRTISNDALAMLGSTAL